MSKDSISYLRAVLIVLSFGSMFMVSIPIVWAVFVVFIWRSFMRSIIGLDDMGMTIVSVIVSVLTSVVLLLYVVNKCRKRYPEQAAAFNKYYNNNRLAVALPFVAIAVVVRSFHLLKLLFH